MSTVRTGGPVGPIGGACYPAVGRSDSVSHVEATSRSARIFNRELGKLVRLRTEAAEQGQVVTQDRIVLEYAAEGLVLAAKRGETQFDAKEPTLRADEVVAQIDRQRADTAPGQEHQAATPPVRPEPERPEPPVVDEPPPLEPERPALDVRV
jgi:hypothetical protein